MANPSDFSGMFDNLRTVAKLTGHEAEAKALVSELELRMKAVEEKIQNSTETAGVSTKSMAPIRTRPGPLARAPLSIT